MLTHVTCGSRDDVHAEAMFTKKSYDKNSKFLISRWRKNVVTENSFMPINASIRLSGLHDSKYCTWVQNHTTMIIVWQKYQTSKIPVVAIFQWKRSKIGETWNDDDLD